MSLKQPPMQRLRLADGRGLAWYEYGDPRGLPCIYTTGTPASGLIGLMFSEMARKAGVRFISVDKPGYGHSDYMPGRRLSDWPRDIAMLADHLGLQRFAVMGESGGGPHVLALAWGLPDRVTVALSIAGMGPGHESWVREGMKPVNRKLFWLAQNAPWLLRFAMRSMASTVNDPKKREKWLVQQMAVAPASDRAVMERHPDLLPLTMTAFGDAFREGPRGAVQEMQIFGRPWDFALGDIRVPVQIWHGTEDVNVPVAVARRLGQEIPGVKMLILEGAGHALVPDHGEAMLQQVVLHAGRGGPAVADTNP